ncbi:hypothetical protein ASPWEDRAFT_140822 [Aspergillus wentii DTO 134E9]|uniref:Rhodopsin domain-containing protein n=1 Tax=Aspergillus wentii DTO 134E9 TaxID=1073089 RepID=A0A1L9R7Q3_ASPWE|nr:uncharacterized protein ASPWEDRAFT_140822 [Aspergillus wentii DTO 134E9]OJJ30952.1 hypothetical protein ASPWEDRAFT_140822 [Aspergillus wentii DTO 134E9]
MAIYADDAHSVAGSVIMLTAIAFITYGLRVYCRVSRKSWGTEDWIMTAALAPFAVLIAGCLGGAFNGIGVHNWRLQQDGNQKYLASGQKFFLIFEVGYCAAIIPIKMSISFMLIRVAEGRKLYIYIQYAVMAIFVVMNFIALIFILTNCIPIAAAWDSSVGGSCKPAYVLADVYYACTAVNIVTDWITAFMPIPLVWKVQLNRNTKISIICLMSLGIFASLSACVRLKYTVNLTNQTDFLFGVANVVIWGFAENAIGMIVGNVSTLRPLFRILWDRTGSSNGNGNGYSNGYTGGSRSHGFLNSRRTNPTMLASADDMELGGHGQTQTGIRASKGFNDTVAEASDSKDNRSSQSSDRESQKNILREGQRPGQADIYVNHQVTVTYH